MAKRLSPEERELRNKRIHELHEQGWTQGQIVNDTGLNRSTVQRILSPTLRESARAYCRQYSRESHLANREANLKRMREYYAANPEKTLARKRRWYAANLEFARSRAREKSRKRRALKLSVPCQEINEKILLAVHPFCGLCGGPFEPDDIIEVDHIIPLSRGGWHTWANVQPAHRFCNRSKKDHYDPFDPKVINIKFKGLTNFERDHLAEEMEWMKAPARDWN